MISTILYWIAGIFVALGLGVIVFNVTILLIEDDEYGILLIILGLFTLATAVIIKWVVGVAA